MLDRIQCYRELTTTSGRPRPAEIGGTTRLYLDDRRVADGELTAADAYAKLRQILQHLVFRHPCVILEGGSLSLCPALFAGDALADKRVTLQHVTIPDMALYRERLYARILDMLAPNDHRLTMLEELANVWPLAATQPFVRTIGGFDVLIAWCERTGIAPGELRAAARHVAVRRALAGLVLERHIEHAQTQQAVFTSLAAHTANISSMSPAAFPSAPAATA